MFSARTFLRMIFFGIDGTLIDHASASALGSLSFYDHFFGGVAFPREGFPEVWEGIVDKHFNRYCRGEISIWEQRRSRMREVFGDESLPDWECDSRYEVYMQEYESLTRAYVDAAPCLNEFEGNAARNHFKWCTRSADRETRSRRIAEAVFRAGVL